MADRTVGGEYENYITPEQTVPPDPLEVPWESCVSLGSGFSYRYDDQYKRPREIVHLLLDILCKGGNLALNLAPQPDGRLPAPGVATLRALGAWLRVNGGGVYGTRPCAPYRTNDVALTRKGNTVYAFRLLREGERLGLAAELPVEGRIHAITLLGYGPVSYAQRGSGTAVDLPQDWSLPADCPALCFACEMEEEK
ncbi:MAG: alpha-L-fucosidase [Eubacteriales bacterium]|nr:alpha-L-fucosidase [Eubacteriales bacterium]